MRLIKKISVFIAFTCCSFISMHATYFAWLCQQTIQPIPTPKIEAPANQNIQGVKGAILTLVSEIAEVEHLEKRLIRSNQPSTAMIQLTLAKKCL